MALTLDALAVLDAIARRGSFAAAAAELGKVPSALTYTVRRLEDELDVLIFDRRGRRAQLTAAGRILLEQGRDLLRAADDLACRVREVASGWEVELRIALDAVIAFDQLRPLLTDFYRLGAPTRLRFSTEVLDGGWDALLAGRADLAIGLGSDPPAPAAGSAGLGVRQLGELRFLWCVAPDHPLATAPEPLEAESLLAHRAVALADSSRSLPSRSAGLLSGQDTLTVASLEQKIAMQIAGLGVGWLPEAFVREHLAAGRLVARRTTRPAPVSTTRYAWRRAARGKALAWWLQRLEVARVRARLLAGPLPASGSTDSAAAADIMVRARAPRTPRSDSVR
jgi:DNA-binding transcriptional LysR family regulator